MCWIYLYLECSAFRDTSLVVCLFRGQKSLFQSKKTPGNKAIDSLVLLGLSLRSGQEQGGECKNLTEVQRFCLIDCLNAVLEILCSKQTYCVAWFLQGMCRLPSLLLSFLVCWFATYFIKGFSYSYLLQDFFISNFLNSQMGESVMEISFGNLLQLTQLSQTDIGQIGPVVWLNSANTVSTFFVNLLTQLCQRRQHIAVLNWSRLQKDENFHVTLFWGGRGLAFCTENCKRCISTDKIVTEHASLYKLVCVFPNYSRLNSGSAVGRRNKHITCCWSFH